MSADPRIYAIGMDGPRAPRANPGPNKLAQSMMVCFWRLCWAIRATHRPIRNTHSGIGRGLFIAHGCIRDKIPTAFQYLLISLGGSSLAESEQATSGPTPLPYWRGGGMLESELQWPIML